LRLISSTLSCYVSQNDFLDLSFTGNLRRSHLARDIQEWFQWILNYMWVLVSETRWKRSHCARNKPIASFCAMISSSWNSRVHCSCPQVLARDTIFTFNRFWKSWFSRSFAILKTGVKATELCRISVEDRRILGELLSSK
jgi:hypothetical protein